MSDLSISDGKGPSPTRVEYALKIPIVFFMSEGTSPVPVKAPPIVELDDVTNGYDP